MLTSFQKKLFLLFIILIPVLSSAQHKGKRGGKGKKEMVTGEIFGKIIDQSTDTPMEYATISLYALNNKLVTGAISNTKGNFELTKVPLGAYYIEVSFIGYQSLKIDNINLSTDKSTLDLGTSKMGSSALLEEVVIDGTSPQLRYEIDKKVVDVAHLNTNLAQSAVEILENIPSISVDEDGTVNMRGSSSFTLLIDGKPTAMTSSEALTTIPASMIKNIELITNPSAKYDAEGVSGIINIIMKQNKLKGASLLANLSVGNFNNYGGDVSTNYRTKKHGINLSLGYNNRTRPGLRTTERIRTNEEGETKILSDEDHDRFRNPAKISGEYIYEPSSQYSLILGGTYRTFNMNSETDIRYQIFQDNILEDAYDNIENNVRDFISTNVNLTFRYNLKRDKKHYIEFKTVRSSWNGTESLITDYQDLEGTKTGGTKRTEDGPSNVLRFNIDYSRSIGKGKFETGLQFQKGFSADESYNYNYDPENDQYIIDDLLTKNVDYLRTISAGYALYGNKYKKLGYQVGLRIEHTDRDIVTEQSDEYPAINRFDFFPSMHLSYRINKKQDLLVNYSKRINRPRSYFLEPFITYNSVYDISSGNPELQPEYIDAFEINWVNTFNRRGNISVDLYYRNTNNLIQRTETIYKDEILIRKPINIGNSSSIGSTISTSYKIKSWWKSDLSFNLYQFNINGDVSGDSYDRSSFNWDGRWNNTFPLPKDWRLQLTTNYQSKSTTIQGNRKGFVFFNASVKKSFANNKYSVTLQANDILASRIRDSYIYTNGLSIHSIRTPRGARLNATFSMRLNNYKSSRRNEEVDDI